MSRSLKISTLLLFTLVYASIALALDTLVMKNGSSHTGTFVSANSTTIAFREGQVLHHYPRATVQAVQFGTPAGSKAAASTTATTSAGASPAARQVTGSAATTAVPRSVTLPAGSELVVLTNENVDSKTASQGQAFSADVAENVTDSSGQVVIPKGSPAELVIRRVSGGNITGGSELALDLQSVKVGGHRYLVSTQDVEQKGTQGIGANRRTAEMIGGGAALGTLIGAVAGGGKGAAIGAIAGAGAGTGAEVLTRGKSVEVPAESKLRFKLDQPLRLDSAY